MSPLDRNVVTFVLKEGDPVIIGVSTFDEDCLRQAWWTAVHRHQLAAAEVLRVHTEWEPSPEDARFLNQMLPGTAISYDFRRPGAEGWPRAFERANRIIRQGTWRTRREEQEAARQEAGSASRLVTRPASVTEFRSDHG